LRTAPVSGVQGPSVAAACGSSADITLAMPAESIRVAAGRSVRPLNARQALR
jgi:hypothetical protein